jgi:NADH-quinone oxidoreductase subunit H
MTEYSSIKFLLYMLSEYVAMVSMSASIVTMFLGGGGTLADPVLDRANEGWSAADLVPGQDRALLFLFVWVRATLPRLRYDQFMRLGWKVLLPLNLAWILLLGGSRCPRRERRCRHPWLFIGGVVVTVLLVALLGRREAGTAPHRCRAGRGPASGSFPCRRSTCRCHQVPGRRVVAERLPPTSAGLDRQCRTRGRLTWAPSPTR